MTHRRTFKFNQLLLCGGLLAASACPAVAALGQAPAPLPPSSLAAAPSISSKKLAATPAMSPNLYTLHESTLESGTTVREYATLEGVVFAVTWHGPVLPDLSDLLGNYFSAFKLEVEQSRAAGRRGSPVNIQRDELVVKSHGRMRHFSGYAYAPFLVPAGVNINDVLQ
jgi:hypothetical protein